MATLWALWGQCFRVVSVLIGIMLVIQGCSVPQKPRNESGKPLVRTYSPKTTSSGDPWRTAWDSEGEKEMSLAQLSMLDPPSTFQMIDRAVSRHRQAQQDAEAQRLFIQRHTKGKHSKSSRLQTGKKGFALGKTDGSHRLEIVNFFQPFSLKYIIISTGYVFKVCSSS